MVVSIRDNIVVDFVVDGDVNEERSADVLSLAAFERKNVFDLSFVNVFKSIDHLKKCVQNKSHNSCATAYISEIKNIK